MAKLNRLIHFISLMLAGIILLCACNTASVAPNEPTGRSLAAIDK